MENKKQLIAENDIYALFEENGTARLHVGHIDALPRVDAVEVVRCKNCRWWKTKACFYHLHGGVEREPNDFCSDGDRKDAPLNYLGCTKC